MCKRNDVEKQTTFRSPVLKIMTYISSRILLCAKKKIRRGKRVAISESIFRAYDIRGVYGKDLTEEVAEAIGKALGKYLGGEGKEIIVGRDVRLSGASLENAFVKGVLYSGCNVQTIGVVPSPVVYFAIVHYGKDGGAMITASHNPPEWNGFKLCRERGLLIAQGMGMEEVREITVEKRFSKGQSLGKSEKNEEVLADYRNFVLSKVQARRKLRVAMDLGNGSCFFIAPKVFEDLGHEVIALNSEPNGNFPAHPPEPTEETLSELANVVVKERADFGVGFDGDGDRALFIDDKGRIVPGDIALIVLSKSYLEKRKGAKVVYEVSCSSSVEEMIRKYGGIPIVSRVGHAYITDKMIREEAILGGEVSSHLYFADVNGFDDAVFGSLKMAELLTKTDRSLSEMVDSIPRYPSTPVMTFNCPDSKKFKVVQIIKREMKELGYEINTIDGVKVFRQKGWFLIRASNTLPQIKMVAEAKNERELRRLTDFAEKLIQQKIMEST
jgi:phosphoglucosamine mutase